jgi:hypothetical protein
MKKLLQVLLLITTTGATCTLSPFSVLRVETEFFLLNLTRDRYMTVGIRASDVLETGTDRPFNQSALLAPGAVLRRRFVDLFPRTGGCPQRADLRVHLYHRINSNVPIGLDPGEAIDPVAFASAEFTEVPACKAVVLSTYTIVLRETASLPGEIVFAQGSQSEALRQITGNDLPNLDQLPQLAENEPLSVRVITPAGQAVAGIGVLLKTRYRVTADDTVRCPNDDPVLRGLCFSEPIMFGTSDTTGKVEFSRPAGSYGVEVFADGFTFRPLFQLLESPLNNVTFVAEAMPQ